MASGVPLNSAILSSSSRWRLSEPASVRTPCVPVPNRSIASRAAALMRGWPRRPRYPYEANMAISRPLTRTRAPPRSSVTGRLKKYSSRSRTASSLRWIVAIRSAIESGILVPTTGSPPPLSRPPPAQPGRLLGAAPLRQPPQLGLVEDGDPELLRLAELRTRRLAHDKVAGQAADAVRHSSAALEDERLRLLARHPGKGPGDHKGEPGQRLRPCRLGVHSFSGPHSGALELLENPAIPRLAKPLNHRRCDAGPHPLHLLKILAARRRQGVEALEVSGEIRRRNFSHSVDSQGEDHPSEGPIT